jgi:hypothetical protein
MAASITLYSSMKKYIADGTIDLDTDTFKVALVSSAYTPNASTHTVYADLTNELSTANGYTLGGASLGSVTWTRSGGTVTFDAADTIWTASGGSIVARYAIIYKDTTTANGIVKPLIAYVLMDTTPADVTTTSGNTLTLQWNGSGIFTLS